eukprot:TRINITY_DN27705_c0_g1_i1.p1 TRINITY_DN27705_c0_g1~~TRINITY_DN27705_c0_g1_i1.p1  ORF type:complete len:712 (+),score=169.30 TRINITY_DN27705_c0_g1_i1:68-2203(+)
MLAPGAFDAAALLSAVPRLAAAPRATALRQELTGLAEDIEDGAAVLTLEDGIRLLAGLGTKAVFAHADGRVAAAALAAMAKVALRVVVLAAEEDCLWAVGCVEKFIEIVHETSKHRLSRVRVAACDAAVLLGRHPSTPRVLVLKLLEVALGRLQDTEAAVRLASLTFLLCATPRLAGGSTTLFDNVAARLPQLLTDPSAAVRVKVGRLLALGHFAAEGTLLAGFYAEEWAEIAATKPKTKSLLMETVEKRLQQKGLARAEAPDTAAPAAPSQTVNDTLGMMAVALEDNAHAVRQAVLRSIARLGLRRRQHPYFIQTALPFVIDSCFDENQLVRLEAIRCVAEWSSWVSLNTKQITILLDCLVTDSQKVLRVTLYTLGCLRLPDPSTLLLTAESLLSVLTSSRFGPQFSMINQALVRLGRQHMEWVPDILDGLLPAAGEPLPPPALKGLVNFLSQSPFAMATLPMDHPRIGQHSIGLPYQHAHTGRGPHKPRDTACTWARMLQDLEHQHPAREKKQAQAPLALLADAIRAAERHPGAAASRALRDASAKAASVLHPMPRRFARWLCDLGTAADGTGGAVQLPSPPGTADAEYEAAACCFEQRAWLVAEARPEWRTWRTVGFLIRGPVVHSRLRTLPTAIALHVRTPHVQAECSTLSCIATSGWGWDLSWRLDVDAEAARPGAPIIVEAFIADPAGAGRTVSVSRPTEIAMPK